MELLEAIKKFLSDAKAAEQAGQRDKAAAAYDKAAHWLVIYAEQAATRDIEANRKTLASDCRKKAQRLRGESGLANTGLAQALTGLNGGSPTPAARARLGADRIGEPPPGYDGLSTTRDAARGLVADDPVGDAASEDSAVADPVAAAVRRLIQSANVDWADIGGLEETKREIKYALGLAVATPPPGVKVQGFRNILLYGPPGTGKTLLAAATSRAFRTAESRGAVFYNVKVSSVMSKYFGESTKIISELYGQARDTNPSVVFLDEFDALAVHRDADNTGPERRILSTILSELDGLSEKGRPDIYVLTIAATNRPWDMDPAVLSRFEKPIHIPLPDAAARRAMLTIMLEGRGHPVRGDRESLVALTEGLSGREIERLCKEVINRMISACNVDLPALVDSGLEAVRGYRLRIRPLEIEEFAAAREGITPVTGPTELARYEKWRSGLDH